MSACFIDQTIFEWSKKRTVDLNHKLEVPFRPAFCVQAFIAGIVEIGGLGLKAWQHRSPKERSPLPASDPTNSAEGALSLPLKELADGLHRIPSLCLDPFFMVGPRLGFWLATSDSAVCSFKFKRYCLLRSLFHELLHLCLLMTVRAKSWGTSPSLLTQSYTISSLAAGCIV